MVRNVWIYLDELKLHSIMHIFFAALLQKGDTLQFKHYLEGHEYSVLIENASFWFLFSFFKYLNTPFIVPEIKPRLKKNVSNLVSIKCMYKRGTKPETFFFTFYFIPGTKNGVLRYWFSLYGLNQGLPIYLPSRGHFWKIKNLRDKFFFNIM